MTVMTKEKPKTKTKKSPAAAPAETKKPAKANPGKGKGPKAEATKAPLKKKWEVKTGVPDGVVTSTYLDKYRKKPGALSVDELRGSKEAMSEFAKELPEEFHAVDTDLLGKQLESLRKTGAIKLGTGRVGPSKGYKEKTAALLKNVLSESGIPAEKQQWILDQVEQSNKEGLTPSQVKILQCLVDEEDGLTRVEIAKKAELSPNMTTTLGRSDGNNEGDGHSLSGLGYVKAMVENEGRRTILRYSITGKGKKAIE